MSRLRELVNKDTVEVGDREVIRRSTDLTAIDSGHGDESSLVVSLLGETIVWEETQEDADTARGSFVFLAHGGLSVMPG